MRYLVLALLLVCAAPAAAQPQMQQRAFEAIPDDGVFIRGGSTVINADPRCPQGCRQGQTCQQICGPQPCAPEASPDAVCTTCTWTCAD
ncbi:MAG: hypothetical protein ABI629_12615 [bacterium]